MSQEAQENKYRKYTNNPLLRREAGEGWAKDGLHNDLLGAIALRELLLDDIVEHGGFATANDRLLMTFERQMAQVVELKEKYHIGDPPPQLDK